MPLIVNSAPLTAVVGGGVSPLVVTAVEDAIAMPVSKSLILPLTPRRVSGPTEPSPNGTISPASRSSGSELGSPPSGAGGFAFLPAQPPTRRIEEVRSAQSVGI